VESDHPKEKLSEEKEVSDPDQVKRGGQSSKGGEVKADWDLDY